MKVVFPKLYAIIDADLLRQGRGPAGHPGSELAVAAALAESGVELIQYRDKMASPGELYSSAAAIADALRPAGVRFIVNDRPDIAAAARAGGVHVGQRDLGPQEARGMCPRPMWIGVSTHTPEQVVAADATDADYVAIGPIFKTATKNNPDPVVGIEFIHKARNLTSKPLVAIGGITLVRAAAVFAAGADCIAVASDLITASDVRQRARKFLGVAGKA